MANPLEQSDHPICSVNYAREHGLDLSKVKTCHPMKVNGIMGCPQFHSCRFHLKQMGGFKSKGTHDPDARPHYVGYFLRPVTGPPKLDVILCSNFVMAVQPLMDEGNALRLQGKSGAFVKVVAQEGETIKVKRSPQTRNKAGELVTEHKVVEIKVPRFPDPDETNEWMSYEEAILKEHDAQVLGVADEPAELDFEHGR